MDLDHTDEGADTALFAYFLNIDLTHLDSSFRFRSTFRFTFNISSVWSSSEVAAGGVDADHTDEM